jgi:hypothetical protein
MKKYKEIGQMEESNQNREEASQLHQVLSRIPYQPTGDSIQQKYPLEFLSLRKIICIQ